MYQTIHPPLPRGPVPEKSDVNRRHFYSVNSFNNRNGRKRADSIQRVDFDVPLFETSKALSTDEIYTVVFSATLGNMGCQPTGTKQRQYPVPLERFVQT